MCLGVSGLLGMGVYMVCVCVYMVCLCVYVCDVWDHVCHTILIEVRQQLKQYVFPYHVELRESNSVIRLGNKYIIC